jgi:hypothetical protein
MEITRLLAELVNLREERDRLKAVVDADSEFILEQAKEAAAPITGTFKNEIH